MPYTFIPRDSTVEINCTAQETSYTPFWLINLAGDTKNAFLQFTQRGELNAHGVYELPQVDIPGMASTVRLLINDTERNNQTVMQCDQSATETSITTLFVFGK